MPWGHRNLLKNDVLLNGRKDSSIQRAARSFLSSSLLESKIHINTYKYYTYYNMCVYICVRKATSYMILQFLYR